MVENKIICLLGSSCCGKDTIRNMMINNNIGISAVSTTTRPMRKGEVEGLNYYYLTQEEFKIRKFVETREYTVANGDVWYYGYETKEIESKLAVNNIVIVVDLKGFMDFKAIFGDKVVGAYITLSRDERIRRYLNRDEITFDVVEEAVRRIKDDDERAFNYVENWVDFTVENPENSLVAYNEIIKFLRKENML